MQARRRHNPQSAAPQGPQQGLLPIRAPIFEHAGDERRGTPAATSTSALRNPNSAAR
jgi:hypothetical protein